MKKALLIAITALVAITAATPVHAAERFNVLFTGGAEDNVLDIRLSPDGRFYIVNSAVPLEVGGDLCTYVEGRETTLSCGAVAIASFEVNSGPGDDSVIISPKITLPTTLRGGLGNDRLRAGAGADKLIGGAGDDILYGWGADDLLIGGSGEDWLFGQGGDDRLLGGPDDDWLNGGSGNNSIVGGPGHTTVGPYPPGTSPPAS
jgi:Ca2+-binding RTX toxin-like protein